MQPRQQRVGRIGLVISWLVAVSAPGETVAEPAAAGQWRHADPAVATMADDATATDATDRAATADPEGVTSRADLGEIEYEGRWVSVEYAQYLAERDDRLAEYQDRCAQVSGDASDHLRLARWCDRQGLEYEARFHWLEVLKSEPNHRAALSALNATWRGGRLWEVSLAEEAEEALEEARHAAASWEKRFRRFERRPYVHEGSLATIHEDLDGRAVAPIERRIAVLSGDPGVERPETTRRLVGAFFDRCDSMPEVEVTASLCRIAILAGDPYRDQAKEALRSRPEMDSTPLLLSTLVAPIEEQHRIRRDRTGNVIYEHQLIQEGSERDRVHERRRSAEVAVTTNVPLVRGFRGEMTRDAVYSAMIQARFEGLKNEIEFRQEAAETEASMAAFNEAAERVNRRVISTLREITGRDLGAEPRAWWEHWRRYTGYDTYERPVERTYDVTYKQEVVNAAPTYIRSPPRSARCECFIAGTPVWTRTGQRRIESICEGDFVLARDPDRGGLTFRAVIGTTRREPSPMVEIVAGEEAIQATVGHPFWVVGKGWRMAKQIVGGDVLSTIKGTAKVISTSVYPDQTAYNLIVEGAANYYVGEQGILVHDNTPRVPGEGLVVAR